MTNRFTTGNPHEWSSVRNPTLPSWSWAEQTTERAASRVRCITPDGTVYCSWSHYAARSTDWGATWSSLLTSDADLPQTIRQLLYLPTTGEFLAACTGGYAYKSDTNFQNWRQVLDYEHDGNPFGEFGVHVYDDIILLGSYGDGTMTNVSAYLSRDNGETWVTILTLPGSGSADPDPILHIHDVQYDPYEGIIWVTTGDDYLERASAKNRIYWSRDWGETWQEWRGFRSTQVIPLPNRVLFVSDENKRLSVARTSRPVALTSDSFDASEDWIADAAPTEPDVSAVHWGSNAAIDRTHVPHRAFFGFRQSAPDDPTFPTTVPATVWTTTDGGLYLPAWRDSGLGGMIGGVYGPDSDGNFAVALLRSGVEYLAKLTQV